MNTTLATVYKEEVPFIAGKPWKVKINPDKNRGIMGGIMGPWKTKRTAQKWADEFNKIQDGAQLNA